MALQELAATYTQKTGVQVKVVTAASGTYSDTLNANIGDVTIYNIGNMAGLADWDDYALDLTNTAIAAELTTNDFNLYNEAGELRAMPDGSAAWKQHYRCTMGSVSKLCIIQM